MSGKKSQVFVLLSSIRLCIDRIEFLDWICKNELQYWFFGVLRFGFSPKLLYSLSELKDVTQQERARLHTLATSYLRAGNTVKTTGFARTVHADYCVLEEARRQDAPRFLEVGVSDGSSSMGIFDNHKLFSEIKLTDRYPMYFMARRFGGWRFFDVDGCTHGRKTFALLFNPVNSKPADISDAIEIESINPAVKAVYRPGSISKFDVFTTVEEKKFDIIKCSNLLNQIYFDNDMIYRGILNLTRSLQVGGSLIISHNNKKYEDGEAVICARLLDTGRLQIYRRVNDHELLDVISSQTSGCIYMPFDGAV